jgi:hypothetical protein
MHALFLVFAVLTPLAFPLGTLAMFLQTVFDRPRPRTPFAFLALEALFVALVCMDAGSGMWIPVVFGMGLTAIAMAAEISVRRELWPHWAAPVWGILVTLSGCLLAGLAEI